MLHDYLHPGVTSQYLKDTKDSIFTRYQDPYLENFHYHEAMLMINAKNNKNNIFAKMDKKTALLSKRTICELILSTALSKHNSFLSSFREQVDKGLELEKFGNRLLLLKLAIKCADVSNPAKKLELYRNWTIRITDEFYAQGDLESVNDRVVTKFMDRTVDEVHVCQIGFINFIVKPLFCLLEHYKTGMKELYEGNFAENIEFWKLESWTKDEVYNESNHEFLCRQKTTSIDTTERAKSFKHRIWKS